MSGDVARLFNNGYISIGSVVGSSSMVCCSVVGLSSMVCCSASPCLSIEPITQLTIRKVSVQMIRPIMA